MVVSIFGDLITFALVITLILIIFFDYWTKHWKGQLPGPFNVPLLGYVPFFCCKKPHELLAQLRSKYGSIIGFYLGEKYVVVLNDAKAIRDVLNREEFLGRPSIHPINLFEKNSMFHSNGVIWKREKRLALRIFREFGFGRKILEEKVKDEISYFMARIKKYEGLPFELRKYLQASINNNISSLIFGHRFDYSDPTATLLMKSVLEFAETNDNIDVTAFFPYLKPIIRIFGENLISKCRVHFEEIQRIIRNKMENEKKHLDDVNIRNYLHGYLLEMENNKEYDTLTEDALMGTAKIFYMAGNNTTLSTIEWLLLALILNPDVQARVQREIDEVLSSKMDIYWSDQKDMHYIHAVILETMRWRTLIFLSVPRCVLKDTTIEGYKIPRNTIVFPNIWAAHNDPTIWEKPEEFNPQRFLDGEGKVINSDLCTPFSIGRRSCPGENMARMEVFLYLVSIFRNYHVSLAERDASILDGIPLFTHIPKRFKVLLTPRKQ